jgi:hypothetical protein
VNATVNAIVNVIVNAIVNERNKVLYYILCVNNFQCVKG